MNIQLYNEDCIEGMKRIPDGSVDVVLTDPPYLYLKNQKLERQFDEHVFFEHVKRILKKDGFIVMFGRGTSFYRWNTILADLAFHFKEEIIWDKSYCTSPLMAISRVHETVSIHTKGKGVINRCKIPYLEMKGHDPQSIMQDIKRMSAILHNPKSLKAVEEFLCKNQRDTSGAWPANNLSISSKITKEDRSVSVMRSISNGMCEKTVVCTGYYCSDKITKHAATVGRETKDRDRASKVAQTISVGANEKSLIKVAREHYSAIHPTQKPVRLLERLLNLVSKPGAVVVDPFMGSGSTAIACLNSGRHFIGWEIDKEYFHGAEKRIAAHQHEQGLFANIETA